MKSSTECRRGFSRILESVAEAGYTDQTNKPANILVLEVVIFRTV